MYIIAHAIHTTYINPVVQFHYMKASHSNINKRNIFAFCGVAFWGRLSCLSILHLHLVVFHTLLHLLARLTCPFLLAGIPFHHPGEAISNTRKW